MRRKYLPPHVPFVEAYHKGGRQNPSAIIITSSGTTSDKGAALAIALNQHTVRAPHDTAHYIVDSETTYQCVPDQIIAAPAFHCAEPNAIVVKMCTEWITSLDEWDDQKQAKVLERTVDLVAHLVLAYKINVRYLDSAATKKWSKWRSRSKGGLIVKVDGAWPLMTFMNELQARVADLRSKN